MRLGRSTAIGPGDVHVGRVCGDDRRRSTKFQALGKISPRACKVDFELSECQAAIMAAASKWNDMVKEVSNRGRQAYRENDDDQLGRVVLFLLEHMGISQGHGSPTSH